MITGFTGTRDGLTHVQHESLRLLLNELTPAEVHHGDCVGADAEFHALVRQCDWDCRVVVHPPTSTRLRANCAGDVTHTPRHYLNRNTDIVRACKVLIACPNGPEKARSGTWSTVRTARRWRCPVYVVWPDGTVTRPEDAR